MTTDRHTDTAAPPDTAVLVAVDRGESSRGDRDHGWSTTDSVAELGRLLETAGGTVVGTVTQRLATPIAATFIGSGKLVEVGELVERTGAGTVIFDDELSPRQQANVEKALGGTVKVTDRTGLILDIFAQHANTREGKLQVELATYEYELPRLRGMWSHLEKEKLGGGLGARFGSGESQLETDRRLARKRIGVLKRELERIGRERETQRRERVASGAVRIALVGYTNAGKSSLLNRLTGAGVLAYDKLFATLDSTTRRLVLPSGRGATITDTVGFINKLPHQLVAAFRSTLAEVTDADVLLHVVDISSPQREEVIATVHAVLAEIEARQVPTILVFNKVDALQDPTELPGILGSHEGAIAVSALTGKGLDELLAEVERVANRGARYMTLLVPYTRGDVVQTLHRDASVLHSEHGEDGTVITALVPERLVGSLRWYEVGESATGVGAEGRLPYQQS